MPVEFRSREERRRDPVATMRAHGTHNQPAGTWSDDASLTFCLAETLARPGGLLGPPDLADFARRCISWLDHAYWTATAETFDVGNATRAAIGRLRQGVAPTQAGPRTALDNGNGALMRILPLVFHQTWRAEPLDLDAAAYAQMAAVAKPWLCQGRNPAAVEEIHYRRVLNGTLPALPEAEIQSPGYVVHILEAALWCLLTHATYAATVLAAVNLGSDTDTTGVVAGGLAGLAYGEAGLPAEWLGPWRAAPTLRRWLAACRPPAS
ncbi:ADP-ribosylglycohydrolase family protein [Hymenobacter nivis]|uniref:ADP-ribosylglycohydrolase family protein n=1 Tax=Hymenobacter nivis TaxID=1850093 RepID=UPI001FE63450|nr:ADP-ribosylglycohydrolase family protein [Hymenobacter nivis]